MLWPKNIFFNIKTPGVFICFFFPNSPKEMDIKEGNTEGVAMLFEAWKGGAKTMTAKQMLVDVVVENDDEMLKVPAHLRGLLLGMVCWRCCWCCW